MLEDTGRLWSEYAFLSAQGRVFSQNGEDGVLTYLLCLLSLRNRLEKTCFEVGVNLVNGNLECNTAILLNNGWKGVIIDREEIKHPLCIQAEVTSANINTLKEKHLPGVAPTVTSIDVDGIDYWLWKAVQWVSPIVIIEYNAHLPPQQKIVVPNDPAFKWDGSDYFGASAGAMLDLAHKKQYRLITTVNHLNMFFVHESLVPFGFLEPDLKSLGPIKRHPTSKGAKYAYLD